MESLRFDKNWRRILLLNGVEGSDIYAEAQYVVVDPSKVGKLSDFCKKNWNRFGFDYDSYSYLIWPSDDSESAEYLVDRLNSKFAGCAHVVSKTPAEAHGLLFDDSLNYE